VTPRLQLQVPIAVNLPKFNRDGIDAAWEIVTHPQRFPEITGAAFQPWARIRKRRSSLLQGLALTVAALVRRCDRRTFRVGDQRDDGLCSGVPVSELCRATGLSSSRQKRMLRVLKAAGYQSAKQPRVEIAARSNLRRKRRGRPPLQRYAGLPAVRVLTPLLFRRLGFSERKVEKARARGYAEWTRRRAPVASAVQIIGARETLHRLVSGNALREQRLQAGAGVTAAPPIRPRLSAAQLLQRNEQRELRLQQLPKPPPRS